ncbi:hypothetical protein G9A89_000704 [Geosiphon pyriformis]|nr:hypothetical protein G9A89_000704 [Geosiphon pyriformis]
MAEGSIQTPIARSPFIPLYVSIKLERIPYSWSKSTNTMKFTVSMLTNYPHYASWRSIPKPKSSKGSIQQPNTYMYHPEGSKTLRSAVYEGKMGYRVAQVLVQGSWLQTLNYWDVTYKVVNPSKYPYSPSNTIIKGTKRTCTIEGWIGIKGLYQCSYHKAIQTLRCFFVSGIAALGVIDHLRELLGTTIIGIRSTKLLPGPPPQCVRGVHMDGSTVQGYGYHTQNKVGGGSRACAVTVLKASKLKAAYNEGLFARGKVFVSTYDVNQ